MKNKYRGTIVEDHAPPLHGPTVRQPVFILPRVAQLKDESHCPSSVLIDVNVTCKTIKRCVYCVQSIIEPNGCPTRKACQQATVITPLRRLSSRLSTSAFDTMSLNTLKNRIHTQLWLSGSKVSVLKTCNSLDNSMQF